jgi:predicted HicB family RNase H-like nuclease|tara:strand:+ start:69 stop:710 length:642 start_codon:yes stop_codon:yes gene_type:complete
MAEIEYGGVKASGSKLLLIVPLLGTIGGGLWGGFEFYKDYQDMKEQIQSYVAPDLSGFDKQIAMQQEHQITVERHMDFVSEELELFKGEFAGVRDRITENTDYLRDAKHDLKDEMVRMEKHLDRIEIEVTKAEDEMRLISDKLNDDVRELMDEGETEQDRLKSDVRAMIDDANNRFNDKISGLEGYVKRELSSLEQRLNAKLTKALDNPLANR